MSRVMNFLFIWRFNCRLLVSFCYRCLFLLFTCVSVSWSWHDLWPDGPWDVEGNVRLLFGGNLFFFFWWLFHVFRRDVKGSCQTPALNVCLYLWEKKLVTIQASFCKKKKPNRPTHLITNPLHPLVTPLCVCGSLLFPLPSTDGHLCSISTLITQRSAL